MRRGLWRAVTVVILIGLAATSCSGSGRPSGSPSPVVATFHAVNADTSSGQLVQDAHELTVRLHSLGDNGASVVVRRRAVVVRGRNLPVAPSVLLASGTFQVRPALCQSNPYRASTTNPTPGAVPANCLAAEYSLEKPTLIVNSATGASNLDSIPPDPVLASYPSTSAAENNAHPQEPVLVPADGEDLRYLLGPTAMNGRAVVGAVTVFQEPNWVVGVNLTAAGSQAWNALARQYFHELTAFDIDGRAVSVPLTEPSSSTFTSFDSRMEISGNFTRQTARQLAAELDSGPLTAPLSP